MGEIHKGSCFCGAVKIEVKGQPEAMGYCHCTDCAAWAGAPINAFSLWSTENVIVTQGESKLGSFAKTEASHRTFCTECGGHIMSRHPEMGKTDVYLNTVPGVEHKGAFHVFYGEKTMSVPDGLPKFKDLPEEFGGSGDMIGE
ncbi:MAG: GFA family protein [Pseudomonadales bacterium]|nr:GFA family protein [Pseudomonadales bacterium]